LAEQRLDLRPSAKHRSVDPNVIGVFIPEIFDGSQVSTIKAVDCLRDHAADYAFIILLLAWTEGDRCDQGDDEQPNIATRQHVLCPASQAGAHLSSELSAQRLAFQPRRLMIAPAAGGCKRMLANG
jgi:hypothetical protein